MNQYKPYRSNPNSVKRWLSSQMAVGYNWQIIIFCLSISLPTIFLFYNKINTLSEIQNLWFQTCIFGLSVFTIFLFVFIKRPKFVPIEDLNNFTGGKMTIPLWGDAIEWLYFMLNFN